MTFTKYKQISQAKESEINDFYLLYITLRHFPFQNNIKKRENIIILTWKSKKKWSLTKPHSFNLRCR